MLSIEVWDTGIGIPDDELQAIFEEYHQLDNAARERSRGLGLGLSIVQRLGEFAGPSGPCPLAAGQGLGLSPSRSTLPRRMAPIAARHQPFGLAEQGNGHAHHTGAILVVEDDPEVRELLELFLKDEGHRVATAPDGVAALDLVAGGTVRPDLDPRRLQSAERHGRTAVATQLREELHRQIPVIILTGDISTDTLRDIALQDCVQLNKPVKLKELTQAIQRLLPLSRAAVRRVRRAPPKPRWQRTARDLRR